MITYAPTAFLQRIPQGMLLLRRAWLPIFLPSGRSQTAHHRYFAYFLIAATVARAAPRHAARAGGWFSLRERSRDARLTRRAL